MSSKPPSVRKALSLSFTRTCFAFTCNVATVTIVSRLLTPAEIGVFSVAAALVALAQTLRDFGVSELIVQEKTLSEDVIRTAFTVNLIFAWSLAAIVFGCSNPIADFYGDPGVANVTKALSLLLVLMPFGTTTMSWMKRDMQFGLMVRIQVMSTIVRSVGTIVLAYIGFSYMSMAWSSVAAMAVVVIGCALWGGAYRLRGLGLREWRRVLHFGANRTIADIVAQVGAQSADIIVGRMFGMAAAGFYSRGFGVVNMFRQNVVGAIGVVAFPAYAREHRERNAAPWLFRKSMVYLTGISWPFFAFSALMAYSIIRIAFGPQWDAAVPLMRWLCGAAIVGTLIYQCNSMLTAVGCYRDVTRIEIKFQLVRIGLAVLASFHSVEAVAASQIPVYVVAVSLYYRKLGSFEALRVRALINVLMPSVILMTASTIAPAAVLLFWPGPPSEHFVSAFIVAAGGAAVGWLATAVLLKHPLWLEIENAWAAFRRRTRPMQGSN